MVGVGCCVWHTPALCVSYLVLRVTLCVVLLPTLIGNSCAAVRCCYMFDMCMCKAISKDMYSQRHGDSPKAGESLMLRLCNGQGHASSLLTRNPYVRRCVVVVFRGVTPYPTNMEPNGSPVGSSLLG
jgi:hypothetical protein